MKNRIAWFAFAVLSFLMFAPSHTPAQESSSEGVRKVLSRVAPQYPRIALSMKLQGTVRAEVTVAPNGKVRFVEVKGGHPLLGQSAMEAIREWKWEPGAHETRETVEIKFNP